MHARAMVRTRVRTEGGNVGVLFVVNPGRRTTGNDLDLFERVVRQVTSTYEHAMLERQRVSRTACRFMGVAALFFGIACLVATVVAQRQAVKSHSRKAPLPRGSRAGFRHLLRN